MSDRRRVVFLDRSSLQAEIRPPSFPHEWIDYPETPPDAVAERLAGVEIAVTNKVPLREAVLRRLPALEMIAVAATGTDIVDVGHCREAGISVSNVRGYARSTVPEHVMMMALALRRGLLAYREDVRRGAWEESSTFCYFGAPIGDLRGSTMGIVGYGTIGQGVERLARAFGMEVLISERRGSDDVREGRAPFDQVLERSDVLSLHAPLTPETRHLIGADELRRMKQTALLINCGRGGLVDEAALAAALKEGTIAGAGVDVLGVEPPRRNGARNPLLELDQPNLIVTPHVAWASRQAMQALADQLVENIERWVETGRGNLA